MESVNTERKDILCILPDALHFLKDTAAQEEMSAGGRV